MPAIISHYFLAKEVLHKETKSITNIEWNKEAFYWGAQGPDFFYLSRIFPWQRGHTIREYGAFLHKGSPSKIIELMRKYYLNNKDDMVLSYISGFITHYSFDSLAHPFVKYGSCELHKKNEKVSASVYHHDIEANLDIIVLRHETGKLPTDIRIESLISTNEQVINSISKLYVYLLNKMYNSDIKEAKIAEAILDYYKAVKLMNDKTTIKKQILKKIEKILGKGPVISSHIRSLTEETSYDYANTLKLEWTDNSDNKISTKDFFEIMDDSKQLSCALINTFLSNSDIKSITNDKSF